MKHRMVNFTIVTVKCLFNRYLDVMPYSASRLLFSPPSEARTDYEKETSMLKQKNKNLRQGMQKLVLLLLLVGLASPGFAQSLGDLEIHGFGGWAYGKTDGFDYLIGNGDGEYDNAEFALNISAEASQNLSIVAQVFLDSSNGEQNAELDFAFAEWTFSDAAKVRVGRVKHPFGIYGEVFDVGTLRPFYSLPQSLYGANGFTAKAYNGVGLTGRHALGRGWGIQYDLYGGQIEGEFETPGLLSTIPDQFAEPAITFAYEVNDTVGGRLSFSTPIDGLTVGASAYRGTDTPSLQVLDEVTRKVYAAHAEYLGDRLWVRTEWGHLENGTNFEVDGGYLEVAYHLTQHWQIAGRWDDMSVTLPGFDFEDVPGIFPQLLDHRDLGVGVNYWFRPDLVVRVSYHDVEGNRFAYPGTSEEVLTALVTDQLDDTSNLLIVGAQFSF